MFKHSLSLYGLTIPIFFLSQDRDKDRTKERTKEKIGQVLCRHVLKELSQQIHGGQAIASGRKRRKAGLARPAMARDCKELKWEERTKKFANTSIKML